MLGICLATVVCLVDYHTLARWAMMAYWGAVLPLVLVLFFGAVRFGARRWFDLGFFSLQPSEFAKLAFILAQAHFLSRPVDELRLPANFWKGIGLMLLPFALIFKEPDLGSALVYASRYTEGVPELERALGLQPSSTAVLNNLGLFYSKKKDYARALDYWNRSLSIEAHQPEIRQAADGARSRL